MKKTIFKIMSLALTLALLASLLVSIVPAGALTVVDVDMEDDTISATSWYEISMTGVLNLYGNADVSLAHSITVIFPTEFDLSEVLWTDVAINGSPITDEDWVDLSAYQAGMITIYLEAGVDLEIGDEWLIYIDNVINPDTAAYYTIAVYTSREETSAESETFDIGSPGIIMYYNSAGAYLGTQPSFGTLPDIQDGWTIKVGPGAYPCVNDPIVINADDVTITSTGSGVVIVGVVEVYGANFSLSNVIMTQMNVAYNGYNSCYFNGADAVVDGVIFAKTDRVAAGQPSPKSYSETLVYVDYGAENFTMTDCTVNTSSPSGYQDIGIEIYADDVTIENSNFIVDQTAAYYADTAIYSWECYDLTITNNIFTGSSGYGVVDLYSGESDYRNEVLEISNNTFDGLERALLLVGDYADVFGNTIENSTVNNDDYDFGAISLEDTGDVFIYSNQIMDNEGYSIYAEGNVSDVLIAGNNFYNNVGGLYNDSSDELNCVLNYWGDAEGPGVGNADDVNGDVDYEPFLTVANTNAFAYSADLIDSTSSPSASKDAGFSIRNYEYSDEGYVIGQTLSGNPADIEPPFPAIAYFDVYTSDATDDAMQVNLYADGLTEASNVYFWSGSAEGWTLASNQGLAGSGAYVYFTVAPEGATNVLSDATSPSPDEMQALSFVIVDGIAPLKESIVPTGPEAGATTALCNVPFTWPTVAGATSYQVVIWTTDINSPIVQESVSSPSFMSGCLDVGSYFWKVYAMQGEEVISESAVNSFIAEAPPSTETTPLITITTQPQATITFTQPQATTLTITQQADDTGITPAWIWAIIGIGAILVIVVIVLIVRTRRTV